MENKDIDKAAKGIPQSEHDACNYANGILSKVRDEDFTLLPKSIIWAVAHDAYSSRQSEIDELIEALEEATRWIPVSERLPEADSIDALDWSKTYPVLVLTQNGKVTTGMRYWNSILNKWEWRGSGTFRSSITHWRPIDTPKAAQLLEKYGKK